MARSPFLADARFILEEQPDTLVRMRVAQRLTLHAGQPRGFGTGHPFKRIAPSNALAIAEARAAARPLA